MREPSSPRARLVLRILGPSLLVLGVVFVVLAISGFSDIPDPGPPDGSAEWQQRSDDRTAAMARAFGFGVAALLAFGFGAMVSQVGFLKPISEYVATETGGAMEHASHRGGRGLGRGLKESGVTEALHGRTIVKVRCRSCGAVDDEDAKFCSACGKLM